ncbi:MAG: sigma-70 family RNA polymerase sigma factor [Clostridia bacterium]|nr:sigma-70 family RNA polymerase sigma factor [Clostridia bacterium]
MLLEEELITRSQNGDIDAFEELVARYERKVYAIAYRFMGNPEDASDLAQEAFLKAFQSINGFRQEASFSTWICRIVSNVCRDQLRKAKRQSHNSLDEDVWLEEGSVKKQLQDAKPTPDELYERKELNEYLQGLINNLSPEYKMVVVLRDIQGYSYEEIAQILDCSLGTVKSRLNRARKALRDQINLESVGKGGRE